VGSLEEEEEGKVEVNPIKKKKKYCKPLQVFKIFLKKKEYLIYKKLLLFTVIANLFWIKLKISQKVTNG